MRIDTEEGTAPEIVRLSQPTMLAPKRPPPPGGTVLERSHSTPVPGNPPSLPVAKERFSLASVGEDKPRPPPKPELPAKRLNFIYSKDTSPSSPKDNRSRRPPVAAKKPTRCPPRPSVTDDGIDSPDSRSVKSLSVSSDNTSVASCDGSTPSCDGSTPGCNTSAVLDTSSPPLQKRLVGPPPPSPSRKPVNPFAHSAPTSEPRHRPAPGGKPPVKPKPVAPLTAKPQNRPAALPLRQPHSHLLTHSPLSHTASAPSPGRPPQGPQSGDTWSPAERGAVSESPSETDSCISDRGESTVDVAPGRRVRCAEACARLNGSCGPCEDRSPTESVSRSARKGRVEVVMSVRPSAKNGHEDMLASEEIANVCVTLAAMQKAGSPMADVLSPLGTPEEIFGSPGQRSSSPRSSSPRVPRAGGPGATPQKVVTPQKFAPPVDTSTPRKASPFGPSLTPQSTGPRKVAPGSSVTSNISKFKVGGAPAPPKAGRCLGDEMFASRARKLSGGHEEEARQPVENDRKRANTLENPLTNNKSSGALSVARLQQGESTTGRSPPKVMGKPAKPPPPGNKPTVTHPTLKTAVQSGPGAKATVGAANQSSLAGSPAMPVTDQSSSTSVKEAEPTGIQSEPLEHSSLPDTKTDQSEPLAQAPVDQSPSTNGQLDHERSSLLSEDSTGIYDQLASPPPGSMPRSSSSRSSASDEYEKLLHEDLNERDLYDNNQESIYDEVPSEMSPLSPEEATGGARRHPSVDDLYEDVSSGESKGSSPRLAQRHKVKARGRIGAVRASDPVTSSDSPSDALSEKFEESMRGESESGSESNDPEDEEDQVPVKKKPKAFLVVEEILKTEEEFVGNLVLLNVTFRNFITNTAADPGGAVVPPAVLNRILGDLNPLQLFNEALLQDLRQRVKNWDENPRVADIFAKKGAYLKLYSGYIQRFDEISKELDAALAKYPAFAKKVAEFETRPECRMLKVAHFMLKPVQRMPQYKLHFQEYQKTLTPDSPDYEDTIEALSTVSKVAEHINNTMKQEDKISSKMMLQNMLVGKVFSVVAPGRELVRRGILMKQSRKGLQPRTVLLFNDCLLITEQQPNAHLKVKYVLALHGMEVKKPTQVDFIVEFTIISKQRSFKVQAKDESERDLWVSDIEAAIEEYKSRIKTFSVMPGEQGVQQEGFVLGETAPVWVPDDRVTMCTSCTQQFSVVFRRHHCRACGRVFCGKCSSLRAPLMYKEDEPCRVCEECYNKLREKLVMNQDISTAEKLALNAKFTNKREGGAHKITTARTQYANDEEAVVSGFLHSWNKERKRWKKMWYQLKTVVLYVYNGCEDHAAIESIPLIGLSVAPYEESLDGKPAERLFVLRHPTSKNIAPRIFYVDTDKMFEKWLEEMVKATVYKG